MQLFDEESERVVLGTLMQNPATITEVTRDLQPSSFYFEKHSILYNAILQEYEQTSSVDPIAIIARLKTENNLEKAGNRSYIIETSSMATTLSLSTFQRRVRDLSLRRELMATLKDIQGLTLESGLEIEELLGKADAKMFQVANRTFTQDVQHIRTIEGEIAEHLKQLFNNRGETIGLSSGFTNLDHFTHGFNGGQLIILAARPSVGKTALALNMALHAVYRTKVPVVFFSLEMPRLELVKRLIATHAHVEGNKLQNGMFTKPEAEKISNALKELLKTDLYIDDSASLSSWDFKQRTRKLARDLSTSSKKIGLIVVDYLQLMSEGTKVESRQLEVASISRSLKLVAKELDVPIIALSQMNRSIEQRGKNPYPQLSDLRESGAIEQDADMVMFLHREDFGKPEAEVPENKRGLAELILAKHRGGSTGSASLVFQKKFFQFVDHDYEKPGQEG
ncbi:MAG: replicative DNA helicase [Leptospiraceae bacterium]|nr:replicative DNA helicase [Leptospiraceae bacterium]MCB1199789.1 replicative DNA helicase [Leptospiraceae bacterium]